MTTPIIQPSFAAGELSPFLYGRVDLAKFHVGARIMLNFFVHPHGGASNDGGTRFLGEVDDSTKRHRAIPFQFRASPGGQNYALIFGDLTLQVVMFNGTTWGFVESSPGVRFTLATPYVYSDLPRLKFVQSADTMTLTHPAYATRKLTRTGHAAWTLTPITFAPTTPAPTGLAAGSSGSSVFISVTAINDGSGEESLPTGPVGSSSSSDTWSWNAVDNCSNYNIYKNKGSLRGFVAQVQAASWTDANIDPDIGFSPPGQRNPFGGGSIASVTVEHAGSGYSAPTVTAVDGSGSGAIFTPVLSGGVITSVTVVSGGKNYSPNTTLKITDGAGAGASIQLNFAPDGDEEGLYWHIDSATILSAGAGYSAGAYATVIQPNGTNNGAALSITITAGALTAVAVTSPGFGFNPAFPFPYAQITDAVGSGAVLTPVLGGTGTTNPGCTTYYQQRQVFGATLDQPQTLWFSVTGAFNNMNVSQPTRDDDAITRALTSQKVNEIRHLVPAGTSMLIMTSGSEWRCWPGPQSNALTPGSCLTLPQTTYGCSHVPPVWNNNALLFVQERGSRVRALEFDVLQDQYKSSDMSVLSQHLLYDTGAQYQIQEMAFAEEPFRIVWMVRSDGILLGFTWMPEHEVFAWHRHTTDGIVESVCTIPEPDGSGGYIDAVYLIVARTIGGTTKRYVERMVDRVFATIADAWFVDCGLQYSGAPASTVSGLDHLEGKQVMALADGSVVGPLTVVAGAIALDGEYGKVTVGLTKTADLVTLDLDLPSNHGTVQGQPKRIAQVTLRVKDARGLKVGIEQEVPVGSAGGTPVVVEIKQRSSELLGTPMQPFSGDFQVTIPAEWNRGGRLFVRQDYPLPCTILAIIPEVSVGD